MYNPLVNKNKNTVLKFLMTQSFMTSLENTFVDEFYIGNLEYKDNRTVFINHLLHDLHVFTYNSEKTNDILTLVKTVQLRIGNLKFALFSASVHIYDYGKQLKFSEAYKDLKKFSIAKDRNINMFTVEEELHLNFYDVKSIDVSNAFTSITKKYKILYKKEKINIVQKPYVQLPIQRATGRKLF